ncbi:hypothetical protein [Polyangium sp. y55x31]|uniref:hypothetical protein n=1 Tax=Polyangium sp. y55x31 TaxID=3042688 RepID=UPI00248227BA|nr:hypothetical protein [Polyangium sp. y55x31]MDI1478962.1 hypothetical protein [Polyangium sp. y55x31]
MNSSLRTFLGLALFVAPLSAGCASRTAPFDQMDQAQITVLRLTAPPPPPTVAATTPGALPGIPGLPIPPEMQAAGQQLLQGLNQAAPGLIPPGLLPGGQTQQPAPAQQQVPLWNGLAIVAQTPVTNEDMKNDLLDLFGDEDSFQAGANNCTTAPGMGVSFVRPGQPNVDLVVWFTCSKAAGVTPFTLPYGKDMLTGESHQKLSTIYQALFGMAVPPGS